MSLAADMSTDPPPPYQEEDVAIQRVYDEEGKSYTILGYKILDC